MSLLSDIDGKTSLILVASPGLTKPGEAQARLAAQLGNLPKALPTDCEILWLMEPDASGQEVPHFVLDGKTVRPIPVSALSLRGGRMRWVQDPYLCRRGDMGPELIISATAAPAAKEASIQIASVTGRVIRPVDLRFEGGNLLQLGDTLLLGRDIAYQNGIVHQGKSLEPNEKAWCHLESRIRAAFGVQKLIWVGTQRQVQPGLPSCAISQTTWQPFFHLDLFLMPGGRDPAGHLRLFLGKVYPIGNIRMTPAETGAIQVLAEALDQIALQLACQLPGLVLERLPILVSPGGGGLHIRSLCNGWVDIDAKQAIAYLPDFRKAEPEDQYEQIVQQAHLAAADTLGRCGFRLRWIDMNFNQLATEGGALHCAVKVLARTT